VAPSCRACSEKNSRACAAEGGIAQEFVHGVDGEALVESAGPGVVGLKLFHHGDQFGQVFWMCQMECDGHGEGSDGAAEVREEG